MIDTQKKDRQCGGLSEFLVKYFESHQQRQTRRTTQ